MILIIIGVIAGTSLLAFAFWKFRKILRYAKGVERGLKMVPILIDLPPTSQDSEVGGRDIRDVMEEKVSQAEVLYNVIASTAKDGFKSKFYGQRHIAFEIVAVGGRIRYFAAVPVAMVSVVEQAVLSAYPTARLEEVEDHNIFNQTGKITGTYGGEVSLKEDFAYPIATVKDLKRDAMQSIIHALSRLDEDDGASVQILLRPAHKKWSKKAKSVAENMREEKTGSKSSHSWKDLLFAIVKPLESDDSDPMDKQLSSLDKTHIEAIEEKTRHPAYEVLIRVISSSNTAARSQQILNNIVSAFSLFDAPGLNGFKFSPAKDMESFVTAYIFRFFPPEVDSNILNSVELATLFHFPEGQFTHTSQVQRQSSKQVDGPSNIPKQGTLLGYNEFRGVKKEVRLSDEDRRRHAYILGQTGTGKSTLMENMALQDMLEGKGIAFVDPHGDAVERLLSLVPRERTEDIIYFNPGDMDHPLGLNLFEYETPEQKDFLIQEAINMLYRLYDPQHQGIIGPRYEHLFRNAALTIMADPDGGTLIDIPKLFNDQAFVNEKLKHVQDQTVIDFWTKEMPASQRSSEFGEVKSWFVSKFGAFLSNQMMRNIIGQTKSSLDLREVMDSKKILFVNLSKGRVGELNSMLLGMIFVMKFQAAAMSRANLSEDQRPDFTLYVDEFQNFSTESFATILSEARKYRLHLIVANQYIGQLSEEIRDAVFGNVGTTISFRASAADADFLQKFFDPVFNTQDIIKLPNYQTILQLLISGLPSQPFSMSTIAPLGHENKQLAIALKQLSASKFGRPRSQVEKEIFDRLKTDKKSPTSGVRKRPTRSAPSAASQSGSSFLDEWLEKRKEKLKQEETKKSRDEAPQPTSTQPDDKETSVQDSATVGATPKPSPQPSKSQQTAASTPQDSSVSSNNDNANSYLKAGHKGVSGEQVSPDQPAKENSDQRHPDAPSDETHHDVAEIETKADKSTQLNNSSESDFSEVDGTDSTQKTEVGLSHTNISQDTNEQPGTEDSDGGQSKDKEPKEKRPQLEPGQIYIDDEGNFIQG